MPRTRLIVVAILALAVVAAFAWNWLQGVPPPPAVAAGGPTVANDASAGGATLTTDADAEAAAPTVARTVASPSEGDGEAALGALRILARWPGAEPASGVRLHVLRYEPGVAMTVVGRGLTDAAGVVTFARVPPGKATVVADRGDRKEFDVVAGAQEVVFDLKGGVAVRGTVTDPDGRRLAGATVWLQTSRGDWTGGREVARTDAQGEYALTHIPSTLSLGAYAPGFAPGKLVDLDTVDCTKPPAIVDLQVQPGGGGLTGTVTDAGSAPIADALVVVGARPRHLERRGDQVTEQWSPRSTTTDASGRFAFAGLAPGRQPLAVRAEGFGVWRDEVEIRAGHTTTVDVRLAAGATLHGRATDDGGGPAADAVISAFDRAPRTPFIAGGQIDFDETFGHAGTRTDADGRYRIDGVTPGTVHVFAQRGGKRAPGVSVAYTSAVLEIEGGTSTEWNPLLGDGHVVEGIVRYADGHAMPHVFVTLTDEKSGKTHTQTNGRDGTFRFLCLDATTYGVRVQFWDAPQGIRFMEQGGIVPDRGRLELRAGHDKPVKLKNGTVVGRIDDVAGRIENPKAASVTLHSDTNWFRSDGQLVDGAFRFEDVTPCRFRLALMQGTVVVAQSDWFELLPAATIDVGAIRTEPAGAARIFVARGVDTEACEPKLHLRREGFASSTVVELGRRREVLADDLTPGEYRVTGYAKGMVNLRGEMTVRAGETTELRLAMQAGAPCRFEIWFPDGHKATRFSYRIRAADGTPFHAHEAAIGSAPTRPYLVGASVPVGKWTLDFTSGDGHTGRAEFEVTGPGDEIQARVELK